MYLYIVALCMGRLRDGNRVRKTHAHIPFKRWRLWTHGASLEYKGKDNTSDWLRTWTRHTSLYLLLFIREKAKLALENSVKGTQVGTTQESTSTCSTTHTPKVNGVGHFSIIFRHTGFEIGFWIPITSKRHLASRKSNSQQLPWKRAHSLRTWTWTRHTSLYFLLFIREKAKLALENSVKGTCE